MFKIEYLSVCVCVCGYIYLKKKNNNNNNNKKKKKPLDLNHRTRINLPSLWIKSQKDSVSGKVVLLMPSINCLKVMQLEDKNVKIFYGCR